MTGAEERAAIAKAFVLEMRSRGVEKITDPAVEYHLALLLRPEGHPAIKPPTDSVSHMQEKKDGLADEQAVPNAVSKGGEAVESGHLGVVPKVPSSASRARDVGPGPEQLRGVVGDMPNAQAAQGALASDVDVALPTAVARSSNATSKRQGARYEARRQGDCRRHRGRDHLVDVSGPRKPQPHGSARPMTSFCGSDNDENDYEVGYRDAIKHVTGYLEARIMAVEKQEGRIGAHMPRGPYLSAWDDLRSELKDRAVERWAAKREADSVSESQSDE